VLPRSAAVASVLVGRRALAVAGTHGKTTTTSLLTVALQAAGADPSYAVGGDLAQTGANAAEGGSDLFVVEADESDGAFLVYRPHAAVVTNVEADHLDQWGSEEAYRAGFSEFVGRIDADGFLVCCADDPGAAALLDVARDRGLAAYAVGEATDADVRCVDLTFAGETSAFTVVDGGTELGRVTLRIPGRHYVLDALAALAVGLRLGYPFAVLRTGLETFTGTRRRMELKGEVDGVTVLDDYGHHPTAIAATIEAARERYPGRRLWAVYEPLTFHRTAHMLERFGEVLAAADAVAIADIWAGRDPDTSLTSSAALARAVTRQGRAPAEATGSVEQSAHYLAERVRPGDVVLVMGGGRSYVIVERLVGLLGERWEREAGAPGR
jgi:UDP-N-acetylmuramate--alanine ligase